MNAIELIPQKSAAQNITSVYFDLGGKIDYAIQVFFTGSNLAGTLSLEASIDPDSGFVTVLNSSQNVTSSQGHIWNVIGAGYRYIRVKWVYTSGTGNIMAAINPKV